MKRNIAAITALVIGASCCFGEAAMAAEQKEADGTVEAGNRQDEYSLGAGLPSETNWELAFNLLNGSVSDFPKMDPDFFDPEAMKILGKDSGMTELSGDADDKKEESAGDRESWEGLEAKTLQMPQKLEVMIDPWEVDGKGQIYSERYVIQNTGKAAGVLTLSDLTCRPQEGSGVSVRTDPDGIHGDGRKSIYMEMLFGSGERIVLSEEGAEYQSELKPGEKVILEFSGEVNEHASGKWDNRDIAVGVVYSWKFEEGMTDMSGDASGDVSGDAVGDVSGDVSGDVVSDVSGDVSGDVVSDVSGDAEMAEPDAGLNTGKTEITDAGWLEDVENGKKEPKTVDIDISEDAEICVDSWTADENGNLISIQYVMRNTGNTQGILKLSDPVCRPADQNGTIAQMKLNSREKPQDAEGGVFTGKESIWIELTAESGEKSADGQENLEVSEYEMELKPGEEFVICFLVSPNEMMAEELKDGKAVTVMGYSWRLKEESVPKL